MTIEINTDNKTIKLIDSISINELITKLNKLGIDFKEFRILGGQIEHYYTSGITTSFKNTEYEYPPNIYTITY